MAEKARSRATIAASSWSASAARSRCARCSRADRGRTSSKAGTSIHWRAIASICVIAAGSSSSRCVLHAKREWVRRLTQLECRTTGRSPNRFRSHEAARLRWACEQTTVAARRCPSSALTSTLRALQAALRRATQSPRPSAARATRYQARRLEAGAAPAARVQSRRGVRRPVWEADPAARRALRSR